MTNPIHEERLKRLYSWIMGKPAPPLKMIYIITQKCNLSCHFCGVPKSREMGKFDYDAELTDEEWFRVTREAVKFGIREWELIGLGEAMIRQKATLGIIKIIKTLDPESECMLTTNGTMFISRSIENLVCLGIDKIQFSLDGPDAETHDFLRGVRGVFKEMTDSIKKFKKTKIKLNKDKPTLTINMVINAKNYNRIEDMVRLASQIGVEQIMLTPMRIESDNRERVIEAGLKMSPRQKRQIHKNYRSVKKIADQKKIHLESLITPGEEEITGPTENELEEVTMKIANKFLLAPCYEPWYSMLVDPLGNVGPCLTSASFGIKSLNVKTMSLEEIWHSDELNEIRKKRLEREPLPQCSHCTVTEMRNRLQKDMIEFINKIAGN